MKRKWILVLFVTLIAVGLRQGLASRSTSASTQTSDRTVYAEGVINTPERDYGTTFAPDGKEIFFTRESRESGFRAIYFSAADGGKWTKPEVASFSGMYPDEYPAFSPDGRSVFFASRRPSEGTSVKRYNDIWVAQRTPTGWGKPVNLGEPINTEGIDSHPWATTDGTLYFHSNREGNIDVYRSKLVNGKYAKPERLPFNSLSADGEPFVSPDERFVIFASDIDGGFGSGDLYISCNDGGVWTQPRNLGPAVNTPDWDGCPCLSKDGLSLFVSLGDDQGWEDIYKINLKEKPGCEAKAKSR